MIKSRMAQRGQGGFTLIELLVVVAILAILVGVAVVGVGAMQKNARKSACKSALDTIETAALAFQVSEDGATTDIAGLSAGGYLKKVKSSDFTVTWTGTEPAVTYTGGASGTYKGLNASCE